MNRLTVISLFAFVATACSSGADTTSNGNETVNRNAANSAPASNNNATRTGESPVPASVRAAIPDAQTFTPSSREIPQTVAAEIEREMDVTSRTHTAYLGFSATGGARRQVGAATVVTTDAGEMVIVYDSRDGMPTIREVHTDNSASVPASFLEQFRGKTHDAALVFGEDIRTASGISEASARSITAAIKRDVLIMQELYGAPHTH